MKGAGDGKRKAILCAMQWVLPCRESEEVCWGQKLKLFVCVVGMGWANGENWGYSTDSQIYRIFLFNFQSEISDRSYHSICRGQSSDLKIFKHSMEYLRRVMLLVDKHGVLGNRATLGKVTLRNVDGAI